MNLLDGIGSSQSRAGKSISPEPTLVEWSGGRCESPTHQSSRHVRPTWHTTLQLFLEVRHPQGNAGVAKFHHASHHPMASIIFELLNPIEERCGQALGEIGQKVQVVRTDTTSHLESR